MFLQNSFLQVVGVTLLLQCNSVSSYPTTKSSLSDNYPITAIQDLPATGSLENLAVRHNGDILTTSVTSSTLFQISPTGSGDPIAVAEISSATSLLGIAEMQQDIFYIVASNLTGTSAAVGSNGVWKIDLQNFGVAKNGTITHPAEVSLVAMIPEAQVLNGMCRLALNDTSNLLIADSGAGTVTRINVDTGAFDIVIQDDTMATLPSGIQVGIDGIHVHESNLFYTSLDQGLFVKMPISLSTGTQTAPAEVIVNGVAGDDFALSKNGDKAWVAMNGQFTLVEVDIIGKKATVVANSTLLMADSAVAFGRTPSDQNSLYITTTVAVGTNGTNYGRVVKADLPGSFQDCS